VAYKLLLAGYFGCGNLGDDAVLEGFLCAIDPKRYDVTALSGNPEETFRGLGAPSVQRRDMKAVAKAISACDCLVFPGGSIFQDVTSVKSAIYYSQLVLKARKAGKKVALLGQGIGPLNSFIGKRAAISAFRAADVLAVRDPGSVQTLELLGLRGRARVTADMAFLLPKPNTDQQTFAVGDRRTIGVAPRPIGKTNDKVIEVFGEFSRLLFEANFMPILIEMDRQHDNDLIAAISKSQGGKIPDIRKLQSPKQLQQRLVRMDGLVAMRLHAGILSATVGLPPLMVSYDPKVAAFSKLMGLGAPPDFEHLTGSRLFELFTKYMSDIDSRRGEIEAKATEQSKLARQNIELLDSIYMGD
jgi:polysaccharide pyruvyl transferase CsaB